jgi:hypothetical protein
MIYPIRDIRYGLPRFQYVKATCAMILLRQPVQYIHDTIWGRINR